MADISKAPFMVFDSGGLYVEVARRLARDAGEVFYVNSWIGEFPKRNEASVGEGLEGVKVLDSPWGPEFDKVAKNGCFVFLDSYQAKLQDRLEMWKLPVFGAHGGERLELDRVWCKELLAKLGLPVGPYKVVVGVEALIKELEKADKEGRKVHVKVSKFRGYTETFKMWRRLPVQYVLDNMRHVLGAFQWDQEFIVEDDLKDAVEVAIDFPVTVDGKLPEKAFIGVEVKDRMWVGKWMRVAEMPDVLRLAYERLGPTLKRHRYRAPLSLETLLRKENGKVVGYVSDPCCRMPSPGSEAYQELENFPQMVWAAAHGELIEGKPPGQFACEYIITSPWAGTETQDVEIPAKVRNQVKLHNVVKKGPAKDMYSIPPQDTELCEIGAVVAYGSTRKDAEQAAQRVGEEVKGHSLSVHSEATGDMEDALGKLKAMGLSIF